MIKKILSLFTGKRKISSKGSSPSDKGMGDIIAFVDYVVRALVDEPKLVKIDVVEGEKRIKIINIHCKQTDIGKIIGKNGKTIMAIRALVTGAASRINQQMTVEVVDKIAD